MRPDRHPTLALLSALLAAGLLTGPATSTAQAAPFYYRWEANFRFHWEPQWYRAPRKHVHREREAPRRSTAMRGPLLIAVSIANQEAKIYSGTTEIATTPVSTGVPGHPTPMGVFAVIQKQVYHESNLYSAAPMPHMQRITWSGIALHGGVVPGHPASHGCIRLPRDFATKLYGMTKLGTRVVVTYDDARPIEIAHKALLQPKEAEPTADPKTAALDADTTAKMTEAPRSDVTASISPAAAPIPSPAQEHPVAKAKPRSELSIFISRKQAKLYARYNLEPLLETPITISDPEKPIGTHVFTATEVTENSATSLRWNALSIPSALPKRVKARDELSARERRKIAAALPQAAAGPSAAEALDRIEIPQDVRERVADLIKPGASLIISDNALSDETGEDTDFVVLTP
jgi:L,D-transpeptidase catalytic domain